MFSHLSAIAACIALAAPAAVEAAPIVGVFTAQIIEISGDDTAAAPEFTDQALVTGRFGYDPDLASDSDPDPDRGEYHFSSSAFVSITVNGATYTTDQDLAPVTVSLNRSISFGTQNFSINGGLVPEEQLADASGDFPLLIILGFGNSIAPFLPSDALPVEDFSLGAFMDPNGRLGSVGGGTTPYWVFFQLRSLDISTVAEPPVVGLLGLGLLGMVATRRRGRAPFAGKADKFATRLRAVGPAAGLRRLNVSSMALAATLLLACLTPLPAQAAPTYSFTDLGLLRSGDDFSSAHDLNENGQIVGVSGSLTIERAILWQAGAVIDLGALPGEATSMALGVNASGQIVGGARRDSDDANSRAFHAVIWNDRVIAPLVEPDGATESIVHAINDSGQAVGFAGTAEKSRAALWQGSEFTFLSTDSSNARDINNSGQIAGNLGQAAVLWEVGTGALVMLGDLPGGADISSANAINAAGQVVGQSSASDGLHAFLWTNGMMVDLGVLPGTSESSALDINGRGQVVGASRGTEGAASSAFLWTDGEMFDLNEVSTDLGGWQLLRAFAINDLGWIVGQAAAPDRSEFHAFLLVPVSEPAETSLLGLAVAALMFRRRSRKPKAARGLRRGKPDMTTRAPSIAAGAGCRNTSSTY